MLDIGSSSTGLTVGYIVSLPHSGSTILGYNLSEHPDVIFLGEVGYAIADLWASKAKKNPLFCSCNQAVHDCEFWSGVAHRLPECGDQDSGYRVVVEEFLKRYGTNKTLIDSNKTVEPARLLCSMENVNVRCIHTVRDFRGAAVSEARRKSKRRPNRPQWLTATQASFQWMRKNLQTERSFSTLSSSGFHTTSYEKICTHTAAEIESIWRFLGLCPHSYKGDDSSQNAHLLSGNKLGSSGRSRVPVYDERWRKTRIWWPAAFLFPILPLLNRRWVYS
jgi:hypothetical protein